MPNDSPYVSLENLVWDHLVIPLIFFFSLITCLHNIVDIDIVRKNCLGHAQELKGSLEITCFWQFGEKTLNLNSVFSS